VGAETDVHTISKEEYEHQSTTYISQRDNIYIKAELKTTQERAASKHSITARNNTIRTKIKTRSTKIA